jgi:hypothetical protein
MMPPRADAYRPKTKPGVLYPDPDHRRLAIPERHALRPDFVRISSRMLWFPHQIQPTIRVPNIFKLPEHPISRHE